MKEHPIYYAGFLQCRTKRNNFCLISFPYEDAFNMKKTGLLIVLLILFACNKQEKGIDISRIHFTVQSPYGDHFITHYPVAFKAVDADGNDITNAVRFTVNGQNIAGDTIVFDNPGQYTVSARWDLGGVFKESDNEINAQVIDPRNTTRAVVEDFTGTWCVNCPRVTYHLEQALQQNPQLIAVAIHNRGYNTDPFHFDQVGTLTAEYNITAYPTPLLNRREIWDEDPASIEKYTRKNQPAGIRIENSLNGNQLSLRVKVRFDMDLSADTLKLVVYALENNLHADQANTTSYYGGQNPIPDFRHDHVLRYAFTDVLGDPVPPSECAFDHIYEWNYNGPLPANIADPSEAVFVAYLVKGNHQAHIINANKAAVNRNADYQ